MGRLTRLASLLCAATVLPSPLSALRFYMNDHERACFGVSAHAGSRLNGHVQLENGGGSARLVLEVQQPDGVTFFEKHSAVIGSFGVNTPGTPGTPASEEEWDAEDMEDEDEGNITREYKACVVLTFDEKPAGGVVARRAVRIRLWQAGRAEAGKESAGGGGESGEVVEWLNAGMKEMLAEMQGMVTDLNRLQRRERKLVKRMNNNEIVLMRVALISIAVIIATSAMQYAHYKAYFTSKKLC